VLRHLPGADDDSFPQTDSDSEWIPSRREFSDANPRKPCAAQRRERRFVQANLVSDGFVSAAHIDPNLVNPWGIAFNGTGHSG